MKIVKENISFERGLDPKEAIGVGVLATIEDWVDKKYRVKTKDKKTLLLYSVIGNNKEFIKHLIDMGTEPSGEALNAAITNKMDPDIILYMIALGDEKVINYIKSKAKEIKK